MMDIVYTWCLLLLVCPVIGQESPFGALRHAAVSAEGLCYGWRHQHKLYMNHPEILLGNDVRK